MVSASSNIDALLNNGCQVALIMHGVSGFVRFQSNFDQVPYTDNGKCEELTVTPKLGDTPTKCVLPTYLVQDGNGNPVFQDPNGYYNITFFNLNYLGLLLIFIIIFYFYVFNYFLFVSAITQ